MNLILQLMLQALANKSSDQRPVELESEVSLSRKRELAREYLDKRGITQPIGVYGDNRSAD